LIDWLIATKNFIQPGQHDVTYQQQKVVSQERKMTSNLMKIVPVKSATCDT